MLKQLRLKYSQCAFSLIELMIAIVILGISIMLALPSYRTWLQNTQIRNVAESIHNGMQRMRAEAVSRNTNVSFVLGGANLWAVTDIATGQVIEARPNGDISASVTITTTPAGSTTITLNNLGNMVPNADASAGIAQIDIDSNVLAAAESRELRITVGVGGVVRMCDPNPNIAAGDPRHC